MRVKIELTKGISAFAVNSKGTAEQITTPHIELELPSRDPPAALPKVLEEAVGREFSDMAMEAVYKISVLAALKEVIR